MNSTFKRAFAEKSKYRKNLQLGQVAPLRPCSNTYLIDNKIFIIFLPLIILTSLFTPEILASQVASRQEALGVTPLNESGIGKKKLGTGNPN